MKVEEVRKQVFLDIEIDRKPIGRIVIELFFEAAPLACQNFLELCTGTGKKNKERINLSLKGNYFHRVIKNFIVQAGDLVYCSSLRKDDEYPPSEDELKIIGTGGASIYLDNESDITEDLKLYNKFKDENLEHSTFEKTFNVAMSNNDRNSNTSQFFINTFPSPHLNNKHTIFGRVVHGKSVVREIEKIDIVSKDNYFPVNAIVIVDCGEFNPDVDEVPIFNASYNQACGDVYEEYPDDDENFDKDDFHMALKVSQTIKDSGNFLFKKKDFQDAFFKYRKALRYVNELLPEKDVLLLPQNTPEQNNNNYKVYIDFAHLKKNIYSNLSLVELKLGSYSEAIKYSNFMIEMLEIYPKYEKQFIADKSEFVKCYYRIGKCYMLLNRLEKAKQFLKKAVDLNENKDPLISKDFETVEQLIEKRKESTKKSLAKYFS